MIRKIDELGRIGIPKEVRTALKLSPGSCLEISWDVRKGQIVLQRESSSCFICGGITELVEKNEICICQKCLQMFCKTP